MQEFASVESDLVVGVLSTAAVERRLPPTPESLSAWGATIDVLKQLARELMKSDPVAAGWHLFLEYEVPRRSKRVDVVLLAGSVVIPIEFKAGAGRFDRAARWQAEEYALDLRDFHAGCRDRAVIPVLVATNAPTSEFPLPDSTSGMTQCLAPHDLGSRVQQLAIAGSSDELGEIVPQEWDSAPYRPTPSIVEAALELYGHHDVREISHSDAINLHGTVEAVAELVKRCRTQNRKGVAFITGAPGSGKTLAGLQVVHDPALSGDESSAGIFLSGNRPLVEVISEALAVSARKSGRSSTMKTARREVSTFIQHAYAFRNEYAEHPERLPHEHVVLFDEAQRAWNRERVTQWTRGSLTRSEPELLLDVMNRLPDWGVVVAMVGGGQEINRGEAGLGEWGRALIESHPDWLVHAAPDVLPGSVDRPGGRLFESAPAAVDVREDQRLHLAMNVRSPRAERLNQWVDAVLRLDAGRAAALLPNQREFPMAITRNQAAMKSWLTDRTSEDQRCGLVANAGARRLRAWGLDTRSLQQEQGWAKWFLGSRGDVRSSYQLEVPATNFDCQGLELDWVGICWGSDFTPDPENSDWRIRRFVGTSWQRAGDELRNFTTNSYRVLLTRARRGQVIWVPEPDGKDPTLNREYLDDTYDLLRKAGIPELS